MKLIPTAGKVILKKEKAKGDRMEGSIVIPASVRGDSRSSIGIVVVAGPPITPEFPKFPGEPGDRVAYHTEAAMVMKIDGEEFAVVNHPDIFAVLKKEECEAN